MKGVFEDSNVGWVFNQQSRRGRETGVKDFPCPRTQAERTYEFLEVGKIASRSWWPYTCRGMSCDDPDPERDYSTETMVPQLYDELRRLAASKIQQEAPGQTISATALVHEVYLRMSAEEDTPRWTSKRQFFGAAAESIRRILIDRIRAKRRLKRGENPEKVELVEELLVSEQSDDELLAVHEVLEELNREDPESAELVRLRFFVGLTLAEIAELTGKSVRTLKREWAFAKAWLAKRLSD